MRCEETTPGVRPLSRVERDALAWAPRRAARRRAESLLRCPARGPVDSAARRMVDTHLKIPPTSTPLPRPRLHQYAVFKFIRSTVIANCNSVYNQGNESSGVSSISYLRRAVSCISDGRDTPTPHATLDRFVTHLSVECCHFTLTAYNNAHAARATLDTNVTYAIRPRGAVPIRLILARAGTAYGSA